MAKADLHAGMATAQKDARAVMLKTKLCHEKTGGNETTRSRRSDGCCNCSRALQLLTPPAHRTTVKFIQHTAEKLCRVYAVCGMASAYAAVQTDTALNCTRQH